MKELIIVSCKYFIPLINYIKCYCLKNNICASIIENIDPFDKRTHLIFDIRDRIILPLNFIIYNFEQLLASDLSNDFYKKFKLAKCIFDYSQNNIKFLEDLQIESHFLPYSWFPSLYNIPKVNMKNKNISFMFIGCFNERRRNILKSTHTLAKKYNYKMLLSSSLWNEDYLKQLSLCKISLNIHYYENNTILEIHRIIPCVLAKNIVLTEISDDLYYNYLLSGCVTWITKVTLPTILHETLLKTNEELDIIADQRIRKLLENVILFSNILDKIKDKLINEC